MAGVAAEHPADGECIRAGPTADDGGLPSHHRTTHPRTHHVQVGRHHPSQGAGRVSSLQCFACCHEAASRSIRVSWVYSRSHIAGCHEAASRSTRVSDYFSRSHIAGCHEAFARSTRDSWVFHLLTSPPAIPPSGGQHRFRRILRHAWIDGCQEAVGRSTRVSVDFPSRSNGRLPGSRRSVNSRFVGF